MSFVPTTKQSTTDFYSQISWRDFSPVFDQNHLPICWAVVAADTVVGLANAQGLSVEDHPNVPPLSVQQILDNMPFYNANYLRHRREEAGYLGHVPGAYAYIKDFGLHTATAYPYQRMTGYQATAEGHTHMLTNGFRNKYAARALERVSIESFSSYAANDYETNVFVGSVVKQLKKQPLGAGIYVSSHFDRFKGNGIFEDIDDVPDTSKYGHAVVLTGFGHESGGRERMFWEIKNSYGLEFGDGGYAKIPVEAIKYVWHPNEANIKKK